MKVFLKALLWGTCLEIALILMWLVGFIPIPGFGIFSYLALYCHFLALYFWPAVGGTMLGSFLFQWLIWFLMFAGILSVKRMVTREGKAPAQR